MGQVQQRDQAMKQPSDPSPHPSGCMKGAALASDAEPPLPVSLAQ